MFRSKGPFYLAAVPAIDNMEDYNKKPVLAINSAITGFKFGLKPMT